VQQSVDRQLVELAAQGELVSRYLTIMAAQK
jgi:hypothetical protein